MHAAMLPRVVLHYTGRAFSIDGAAQQPTRRGHEMCNRRTVRRRASTHRRAVTTRRRIHGAHHVTHHRIRRRRIAESVTDSSSSAVTTAVRATVRHPSSITPAAITAGERPRFARFTSLL